MGDELMTMTEVPVGFLMFLMLLLGGCSGWALRALVERVKSP